ncbi:hypothetical protein HPB49_007206 [Dermacentor silvarum]|uniref:Uncharacterized protein n=1 Tax=Dermacentor silvarum TaxID=543639 RepID=A0ACB8C840_DERSI|nr:uncharacterized protein LOC119462402 isoform X1 [Dermacentor silvarum]KAH7937010.1 hypothetical protein HPB49_007206 [Dermacentor silvarum]
MSVKNTKYVHKLERPRPLRPAEPPGSDPDRSLTPLLSPAEDMTSPIDVVMSASADEFLLSQMESLCASLDNGNHSDTDLEQVCRLLKVKGAAMERFFEDQLDTHFITLRNASRDDKLDAFSRLMLLELVELRAMGWQSDEETTEYYCRKFEELGFDSVVYDDAYAVKLAREFQQKQQQEQRSQMETVKTGTKPAATPILPWASQEIKNRENSANPQSVSYQGPLKGEATFQNHSIWKESPNLQEEQMHKWSGTSDMSAKATWQHFLRNEEVVQNANASTQAQTEGVAEMAKVISEDITQYSGPPMQDGKWANGTTTDYLNMYQKTVPAEADAKTCVETIIVGKDLIQISGTNGTIVNISTCVLRSFFSGTTADTFNLANQDLSSMLSGSGEPSNKPTVPGLHTDAVHAQGQTVGNSSFQKSQVDSSHGEAYEKDELRLVTDAVAWPLRDTLQSVDAPKTQSAQGSFERFRGTSGPTENTRFKGLQSLTEFNNQCMRPTDFKAWGSNDKPEQTKQIDGLGSSMQFSRSVDNKHMPSTSSKTLGTTSEPGQHNQFKGLLNPSQLSNKDDGQLLSAGFTALASSEAHSQTRQLERLVGSMQFSRNTENQQFKPTGGLKALGRNDRTDQSKQFLSPGSSPQLFTSFDEQVLLTKALGTTSVLDQPKQFKGLARPALFPSKADSDNTQQPLSTAFTTSGSTSGHSQTKHLERLGASIQLLSNVENQKVPSRNLKPLGYTDVPSQTK